MRYNNVYIYIYIYIYVQRERERREREEREREGEVCVCRSLCMFVDGRLKKDFSLQHLWTASDCLEDLPLTVYFGAKTIRKAVPAWTHGKLLEGPWPELGVARNKGVGHLSLRLAVEGLPVREFHSQERGAGRGGSRTVNDHVDREDSTGVIAVWNRLTSVSQHFW